MKARPTELSTVREGGLFKYVRMLDNTVRFADIQTMLAHYDLVDHAVEVAYSAGLVDVTAGKVTMHRPDSWSLGVSSADDDLDVIAAILWPPTSRSAKRTKVKKKKSAAKKKKKKKKAKTRV